MTYLVLPLSAVATSTFNAGLFLNGVLGHALFVGLPISLFEGGRNDTGQFYRCNCGPCTYGVGGCIQLEQGYPPLQRKGMSVLAVQIPLTSLSEDVATVRRTLKRVSGPVVLVDHSYGGAVIISAGARNPNVKALVYIAPTAPDEGETVGQLLHRAAPHEWTPALVPDEDAFLWMSATGFADAVAHEALLDLQRIGRHI